MQKKVDVAVIGAGTAGLAAYRAVKSAGKSALLIESGPYGTTCARVGCMPSKLLIAAAESAHALAHSDPFGIHIDGGVRVDGREVMDRIKRERDRFVGFVVKGVDEIPAEDKLRGHARFINNNTLDVDGCSVNAERVVIATGSSPVIPDQFKVLGDRLVANDDVFAWDSLPESVAVFGTGVIGLELGQALARLGVSVKVFGHSGSLGTLTDPAVRDEAASVFQKEFYLQPKGQVTDIQRQGDKAVLNFVNLDGQMVTESFDYVLVATGRAPNVKALGLENTSMALDEKGVPFFDAGTLQCSDTAIFMAGDVNGVLPLLHEAADEGKAAGENAAGWPFVKPLKRRTMLAVVFTDPQIILTGHRYRDLPKGRFVTGAINFEDQGRSRVMLKNAGLLHVYADRDTSRFLGAEGIGPHLEHIAHLLAWSCQSGLTIEQMLAMPFYHPVIEEGLRTALREAHAQLK